VFEHSQLLSHFLHFGSHLVFISPQTRYSTGLFYFCSLRKQAGGGSTVRWSPADGYAGAYGSPYGYGAPAFGPYAYGGPLGYAPSDLVDGRRVCGRCVGLPPVCLTNNQGIRISLLNPPGEVGQTAKDVGLPFSPSRSEHAISLTLDVCSFFSLGCGVLAPPNFPCATTNWALIPPPIPRVAASGRIANPLRRIIWRRRPVCRPLRPGRQPLRPGLEPVLWGLPVRVPSLRVQRRAWRTQQLRCLFLACPCELIVLKGDKDQWCRLTTHPPTQGLQGRTSTPGGVGAGGWRQGSRAPPKRLHPLIPSAVDDDVGGMIGLIAV